MLAEYSKERKCFNNHKCPTCGNALLWADRTSIVINVSANICREQPKIREQPNPRQKKADKILKQDRSKEKILSAFYIHKAL